MSDEARRVIKMDVVLDLVAGKGGEKVTDLLCFLLGRDLDARQAALAAPLAKGWLYKTIPALFGASDAKGLGDNVSLTAVPEAESAPMIAVFDAIAASEALAAEKTAKAAEAAAVAKDLEPFKAKAADLEKKLKAAEDKLKATEAKVKELTGKVNEFAGKTPMAVEEVESSIKDMISKAIKDAMKAVPVAGAAGAAAGAVAGEAAAAGFDEPASNESGALQDTFGFGSAPTATDDFGF